MVDRGRGHTQEGCVGGRVVQRLGGDKPMGDMSHVVGGWGHMGARHQHVGSMGVVGHRRGVGQGFWVDRLIVVIGHVVEHIARVMGGRQTLGVRMMVEIIWHLGFVCGWDVIVGHWGHIGWGWTQAKHSLQAPMSWGVVLWFGWMVNWLGLMVGWLGWVVLWCMMRSGVVSCVDSKDLLEGSSMCWLGISSCWVLVRWSMVSRLWLMVSWLRFMVSWFWSMVSWLWFFIMRSVMHSMVAMMERVGHVWILLHVVQWHVQIEHRLKAEWMTRHVSIW
jgi:hypothetical protein